MAPALTRDEVIAFLDAEFPQIRGRFRLEAITAEGARMSLVAGEAALRPGGSVSGPTLFALADASVYAAVLSRVGREALAVTTDATVHFLRRPAPGRLVADARLLRVGRTLCVADVVVRADGPEAHQPVAHAVMSYARPQG